MRQLPLCGILPKKCHVDPSPLATQTAPLTTRGIAQSTRGEFCTADVPPSPDISQPAPATGWKGSVIQLPWSNMSGSAGNAYLEYIRDRRFRFPGQLDSSDIHNLPDPFLPTIKKQTPTTLSTKSPELSLIFNTRYAWQDTLKSSQIAWRIPDTENHKLRWQPPPEYPSDSHHLAPEGSCLRHHSMSRNHDYGTH